MQFVAIDTSYALSHHGVLGMKWGVRNAETLRKYAHDKQIRGYAKKDAKTSVKLDYGFGAGSRRDKQAHEKTVKGRSRRYGKVYKEQYSKTLAKQEPKRAGMAAKAQRKLERTKKQASKHQDLSRRRLVQTIGSIAGAAVGGAVGAMVAFHKTNDIMISGYVSKGSAAVGAALGRRIADTPYRKSVEARRKLNYNY